MKIVDLTPEQKNVVNGIVQYVNSGRKIIKFSGAAGTGKTTVISHLIKLLPNWTVCSFTGKAVSVLRKKGVRASTIHSLIYHPMVDAEGKMVKDRNGNPIFIRTDKLEHEGIIVDESSMISRDLYEDLVSFHVPIIFVGDGFQLPPVGKDIDLMQNADFNLTTLHRNAGEIARFCEFIRNGYRPGAFRPSFEGKVKFLTRWQADAYLTQVDQIICAFNKTRVALNKKVRALKGLTGDYPVVGDKIMCLKNNKKIGLFNGMQGIVKFLYTKKNRMHFESEEGLLFDIIFDKNQFNKETYTLEGYADDPDPFDFANCITGHKSQGSEWPSVLVYEQSGGQWDRTRWNYTVAARAQDLLYWVVL